MNVYITNYRISNNKNIIRYNINYIYNCQFLSSILNQHTNIYYILIYVNLPICRHNINVQVQVDIVDGSNIQALSCCFHYVHIHIPVFHNSDLLWQLDT